MIHEYLGRVTFALMTLFVVDSVQANDLPMCKNGGKLCFTGNLSVVDNPDDKSGATKLLDADFGFVDLEGKGWQTNAKDITNGASIPPALQWIVGQSFDPMFIPAAVIHDRYCDKEKKRRVNDWKSTHRMFYQALVATGVEKFKARLMYYAVYTFGPRWRTVDKGKICRGNLTPACQQLIGENGGGNPYPNDPSATAQESLVELLKKYEFSTVETDDTQADLFRSAIYDDPGVESDLKMAENILNATYSTPDAYQSTIEEELAFIEQLSDIRHPAEGILINTRDP